MKTAWIRRIFFVSSLVTSLMIRSQSLGMEAKESKVALPRVSAAGVPLYPVQAYISNIQGMVRLRVTTDGRQVTEIHVEEGQNPLAEAAEENLRTWRFQTHEPTTFTVTYTYKLVAKWKGDPYNPTVVLRLPTEVEISNRRWPGTVDMPGTVK